MKEPSIYDQLNRWGKDDSFFERLIDRFKPAEIADLGCGTGRLTVHLANKGYNVTGIDPDEESLSIAKRKDANGSVSWKAGTSVQLEKARYEAVIMTSNVAQVFLTDAVWKTTLRHIYESLKPGGKVIFDTRNPAKRAWESWTKEHSLTEVTDPETGAKIRTWHDTMSVNLPLVTFRSFYENPDTLEIETLDDTLVFREREQIRQDLLDIGFGQAVVYGDWVFQEADLNAKSFIFVTEK